MTDLHVPSAFDASETRNLLASEGRIAAIKFVRQRYRISLMEAKSIVESVSDGLPAFSTVRSGRTFCQSRNSFLKSVPLFLGVITLAGTIATGILFGVLWESQSDFRRDAVPVSGTVIQMRGTGKGRAPVVDYVHSGEHHTFSSNIGSSPPAYAVGDSVAMLVDPANPAQATIDDLLHRWFPLFFAGLGCVVMAIVTGVCLLFATSGLKTHFR